MIVQTTLEPVLTALSVILVIGTRYTALDAIGRVIFQSDGSQKRWTALATLSLGLGMWAAKITNLQALETISPDLAISFATQSYDLRGIATSLVVSLLCSYIVVRILLIVNHDWIGAFVGSIALVVDHTSTQVTALLSLVYPRVVGFDLTPMIMAKAVAALSYTLAFHIFFHSYAHSTIWNPRRTLAALIMGVTASASNLVMVLNTRYDADPNLLVAQGNTLAISDLGGAALAAAMMVLLFMTLALSVDEAMRRDQLVIVELRAREAIAAADLERIQTMERLKTDFLNSVSHELRTPLTSIKGYTEFLEDELAGPLSDGQRDFVDCIRGGVNRLENLVDDLLDFARVEAGKFVLNRRMADISQLITSEISRLKPQAVSSGVTIDFLEPSTPIVAPVDTGRIGQVLTNLLGNAVKFNRPDGNVTVTLSKTDDRIRVEVKDTGIGIAPENLPRLFQKFYQVDASTTREHGGTGLGLALSKAIVESHGGTIGATSQVHAGSCFYFELPLLPPTASENSEPNWGKTSGVLDQ